MSITALQCVSAYRCNTTALVLQCYKMQTNSQTVDYKTDCIRVIPVWADIQLYDISVGHKKWYGATFNLLSNDRKWSRSHRWPLNYSKLSFWSNITKRFLAHGGGDDVTTSLFNEALSSKHENLEVAGTQDEETLCRAMTGSLFTTVQYITQCNAKTHVSDCTYDKVTYR